VACVTPACVHADGGHFERMLYVLEGARESAYLRQVNFYRRPLSAKFLRGHVCTVPGNMRLKFEALALTVLGLLAFNAHFKLV